MNQDQNPDVNSGTSFADHAGAETIKTDTTPQEDFKAAHQNFKKEDDVQDSGQIKEESSTHDLNIPDDEIGQALKAQGHKTKMEADNALAKEFQALRDEEIARKKKEDELKSGYGNESKGPQP